MAGFVACHRLGEIAPPHDPEAWARAIDRLLSDPAAYTGDPAERARLRREWSWGSEAPVLLELYERLAAGREAAA